MRRTSKAHSHKAKSDYCFISRFVETHGLICPTFDILHSNVGCPFKCGYCYLQSLLAGSTDPRFYDNYEDMVKEISKWGLENPNGRIKAGGVSDGLASGSDYLLYLIPVFRLLPDANLVVLSKAGYDNAEAKKPLRKLSPVPSVTFSWTLTPEKYRRDYEAQTSTTYQRIKLARAYANEGWQIRARIDPILHVDGWEAQYISLCQMIVGSGVPFDRVTLSYLKWTPRLVGVSRTHNIRYNFRDVFTDVTESLDETGDIEKVGQDHHASSEIRLRSYNLIRDNLGDIPVALCKETPEVSREFHGDNPRTPCDCMH